MDELTQLGRYKIIRTLGAGAMGIVYEGLDTKLHRQVAIKTIIKNVLLDPELSADYAKRFIREAQAVAHLNHPNIVAVYDVGEEGGIVYFVMEFIQGNELKQHMSSGVQFSLSKSLGIIIELLGALDYAHEHDIVHRDIKPANIMLDQTGRVKLTDFGVVKVMDSLDGTQSGTIVGTPGYMSPEQILGVSVSPRADIFAVGVILYQLLTDQKPFTGDTAFAIQHKIVHEDPVPPSAINAQLSPVFDQIINKALAKKPDQRYARASEFADQLKLLLTDNIVQKTVVLQEAGDKNIVSSSMPNQRGGNNITAARDLPPVAAKLEDTLTGIGGTGVGGFEKMLEKRHQLDAIFAEKYHKVITVVFTDLKGSTAIAETEGDLVSRMLIKYQNDIIMPAIKDNSGIFIKSIGDGTLSYFQNAQDAVRAAVRIQKGMDELNMSKKFRTPVLMRIGMHTGKCIVEKNDIAGDVVNTASRFESTATPGDILISEDTYDAMTDKGEIYCRFVKQVSLKGKKETYNAYKAFWNPQEIELDKVGKVSVAAQPVAKPTSKWKLVLIVLVPLTLILLLTLSQKIGELLGAGTSSRSIEHSVTIPDKK